MAKKEQILELLNAYKSEVDNFNDAIFTDKFEVLAQDIVKLFAIPDVIVPKGTLVCTYCLGKGGRVIYDTYLKCKECDGSGAN